VDFRVTTNGGHTGFIAGSFPWRCEYWAEEALINWLAGHAK
jgi:predicted alpha/beta-fold hydrolase